VRHLPPEMYAIDGAAMAKTLKVRRDHLTSEAMGYYAFLAAQAEIRATDAPEAAEVVRVDDHHVDITIARRGQQAHPYFHREFDDADTKEIRVKLWGGNDRVVVRGEGNARIVLRIVGGKGDDELIDSTRTGHVAFYDDAGHNTVTAVRRTTLNTKHYDEWIGSDSSRYPPREWGAWTRQTLWLGAGTDAGLILGGGVIRTSYGFRRVPYASEVTARVGYATGVAAGAAELTANVRRENQTQYWTLRLLATGMDTPRYYGLGNQSTRNGSSEYYRVSRQLFDAEPAAVWPLGRQFTIFAGPFATYSRTAENRGRFMAALRDTLYGALSFGEVGGRLGFTLDARDEPINSRRGFFLRGEGRIRPALGDVKRTYGSVDGRAETYLTAMVPLRPTLALRGSGMKVWGDFPYFDAAFLGGPSSLAGYYQRRFAGDASVSGSSEVRLTLLQSRGFLPARWGIFGNVDAGRVYVNGQSPGGWHTGAGGGVWAALLDRANTATIGINRSKEQITVHVGLGFPL
jgi:surface antigen Omp85-like protein